MMNIIEFCDKYCFGDYTINKDGEVDVDGDVIIKGFNGENLPGQFNKVSGDFIIEVKIGRSVKFRTGFTKLIITGANLTTLIGCPRYVGGSFSCKNNKKLKSLEGAPKYVGKTFDCSENGLTTLKHCPEYIGSALYFDFNKLKSIDYLPKNKTPYISFVRNDIKCINNLSVDNLISINLRQNPIEYAFRDLTISKIEDIILSDMIRKTEDGEYGVVSDLLDEFKERYHGEYINIRDYYNIIE